MKLCEWACGREASIYDGEKWSCIKCADRNRVMEKLEEMRPALEELERLGPGHVLIQDSEGVYRAGRPVASMEAQGVRSA